VGVKSINLIDHSGKQVLYQEIDTNMTTIDISSYPKGLYLYRIIDEYGTPHRGQLMIK
jgi:hypothetical protein